jgi:hypothetical protein
MPLLDHFHPPLLDNPPWTSLYTLWVGRVVAWLNRTLPQGEFRAFANARLGSHVEADVAEYARQASNGNGVYGGSGTGGTATAAETEAPPVTASIPAVFPDDIEVQISEGRHLMQLAGVIEFVSPGNKKEDDERVAFVGKCAAYLQRGIGLVIVDVVTNRLANFHNELMQAIGGKRPPLMSDTPTYVTGYRPARREERNVIDIWTHPAVVGQPIPAVALALRRGPLVTLDLEGTYTEAVTDSGL